jgi:iron complex transport system substrate-binding protein
MASWSCTRGDRAPHTMQATGRNERYAERFTIEYNEDFTLVHLFGNRDKLRERTSSFFLYRENSVAAQCPENYVPVKVPCKRIAALSSIYASMFAELGELNSLVAIDNIDYINNPLILGRYKSPGLRELARNPQIDLEQTAMLRPDIVFTYGMGYGEEVTAKLSQTGIPIAVSVDHLEQTPLARAEWIRFFAAFVSRDMEADSIFRSVEERYLALKRTGQKIKDRPTVFSELKFADVWYMPGGKSYVAQLFDDAGADYLWRNDKKTGSLPLSFEQVYSRARDADYWVNLSMVNTKAELLGHDSRYAEFKAYKNGQLFNNNKVRNAGGFSIYWETGMYHPERILHDLMRIFHPEKTTGPGNDLYYYQRIN